MCLLGCFFYKTVVRYSIECLNKIQNTEENRNYVKYRRMQANIKLCLSAIVFLVACIFIFYNFIYKTTSRADFLVIAASMEAKDDLYTADNQNLHIQGENGGHCSGYGRNTSRDCNNSCKKRFPNCLIIGVGKGGTGALLEFLGEHPQIVRNKEKEEYHFFSANYFKGLEWYREMMPYSLAGQIVIEKSPDYFWRPQVPSRVFELNPRIKVLLLVRDPVQRAISTYAMVKEKYERHKNQILKNSVRLFPSFESSWEMYLNWQYDTSIENWLKFYKLKQIHIIDSQTFSANPVPDLKKVESFLNINHYFSDELFVFNTTKGFYCFKEADLQESQETNSVKCLRQGKGRKHPNISSSFIEKLRQVCRPHNRRFFSLTGRYFDWET